MTPLRFSVGYRPPREDAEPFSDIVRDYKDDIEEVYFAWPGDPSGRSPLGEEEARTLAEELPGLKRLGVRLNLLLNANCYGGEAMSLELTERIGARIRSLNDAAGLDVVTTASPMVARTVRRAFPSMEVRASVNMRLGTVKALEYVSHLFTGYVVQREFNRDLDRLGELQEWADAHGKRLQVLANSGCLNFCSAQTFHDNVVAHEAAIHRRKSTEDTATLCHERYRLPENRPGFLQGSWIRPEDLESHALLFHGGYKLATRTHDNPRMVIDAYSRRRHVGSLLDLMEPGFGPLFHPRIIDNTRFPADWFDRTTRCDKRCHRCSYCASVLERTLVRL